MSFIYLYSKYFMNTYYMKIQGREKSDTVCLAVLFLSPISLRRDGDLNKVKATKLILHQGKIK